MVINKKTSKKVTNLRNRVSCKRKYRSLKGGKSFHGVRIKHKPLPSLDRFANYWNEYLKRNVWYSTGQEGYYFSNLKNFYMSKTHTHIYKIEDLDDEKNGRKRVHYTTKIKNEHVEKNSTVELEYNDIATWLTRKNEEIGADGYIDPIPVEEQ